MGRGEITESLVALVDHCKESGLGSKHEALVGGRGWGAERRSIICHHLICILKRLIWLPGCGKVSVETTSQAETMVSKEWQGWDFLWRKSQQDLLMDWMRAGGEGNSGTEFQTCA